MTGKPKSAQHGSALIVGLILLLTLTILGVAGMTMSRTEILMAGHSQFYSSAKVAALSEVDVAMDQSNLNLTQDIPATALAVSANSAQGTYSASYIGSTPVPGGEFSIGKFAAYHYQFDVNVTQTGRPVDVSVRQGAYLIGPTN